MLSIPQYLLESSFCLAIFYGFYHLFLKKETFFQLNRAYLLATPIAALSIPLLNISFQKDAPPESLEAFFYPAIQSANNLNEVVWEQMRAPSPVFSLSVADIIMAIYLIGIFLMSFSLLKGLWNLGRIIRRGKRSKNNEFTLVETQNNFPAASFFGYIFWNQQITDEQKLILEHEKVHIRQWHSLDVLLMEICVIIKWFNPLIYWFRNALKATHEYIADQYVIEQKSNVGEYATLLVNQHKKQVATPLTNTFYSLTKKRLHKMIQRPSQKIYAAKYLFVFPLVFGMMGLFSFNLLEEIPKVSEGITEMNSAIGEIVNKTVFEINQTTEKDQIAASEAAVKEHAEALAKTFAEAGTNRILYWGDLEIPLNKENGQPVPIIDVPINQFLMAYQKEPIAALEQGGLFEKISFSLLNAQFNVSNTIACKIISDTNNPSIFKENDCLKRFKNKFKIGNIISGYELQIGEEGQRYKFELRLIDPKVKRPNPDGNFTFKWGDIEFPIELRKDDFNTHYHIETVRLNDLQAALNQPITILDDGRPAKGIQDILINMGLFIPTGNNTETYQNFGSYVPPSKVLLEGNGKRISEQIDVVKLMELVDEKAAISFNVNGFDFGGMIRIDDGKYQSPIRISKKETNLFNFQVIIPDKAKTILKVDTTLAENKSIVRMYRNPDKYKIIHIPNFKTATRSIVGNPTNADPVYDKTHRAIPSPFFKTSKEAEVDDNLLRLPEYVGYKPTELTLKWGALTANPRSENYDLKSFLENFKAGLQLNHLSDALTIKQIRVVVAKKEAAFLTFDKQLPNLTELHKRLGNLSTESSIYFDKIIINKNGTDFYLPQHFLFTIGKQAIAKGAILSKEKQDVSFPNRKQKNLTSSNISTKKTFEDIDSSDINFFNLYPFTYSNQAVIRKEKIKRSDGDFRLAYTQKMENYERIEAKRLVGEEAIAEFGEAGRKGVSYVIFQHKKKKKRIQVDRENSPLYIYYMHPFFPMITHKLIYDNLDANDIVSINKFPANSEEARFYGTLGKNGIVEVRFNYSKLTVGEREPVKITIKKANPKWSNTTWFKRDSSYSIYLMKNIQLSQAFKLLKKLPANQITITDLEDDFPIYVSVHGGLEGHQDDDWLITKIQEKFHFQIIEQKIKRKVLVLKKGSANSLAAHEYFTKSLPKIKTIIETNQTKGLKTITPGYFKDYQQLIRENFELPLIDETGLFGEEAICLGIDLSSIEMMKKSLAKYDLELAEEERVMPVYELR
ncbi:MAG: M56 family metallopeptidase [Saprospiraceae bacterium]